jgi:regulator of sigma E protease
MLGILASVVVLGILVILHEWGHFLVARWCGVRVLRFSIGFGPRLFTWQRGDTEYAVSAIPLGGYVKMAGEQQGEGTAQPGDYVGKSVGIRARIVFAGPCVNYLVALLSLWVVYVMGYPELLPTVGKVMDDTPAMSAGLLPHDQVLSINGEAVTTWDDMTKRIYRSAEAPLTLQVRRGEATQTISVRPAAKTITDPFGRQKKIGQIGIAPSGEFTTYRIAPVPAVGRTIVQVNEWAAQTVMALWSVLTGRLSVRDSVTGPIGIVYLTKEAVSMGLAPLLFLMSLFSLSLSIFNLLPIPILDGGHLLFLGLEWLRRRPVSLNIQERAAQVSFVLLVTFVVIVCINDVNRFGLLDKLLGLFNK